MHELSLARVAELLNGTLTGDPNATVRRVAEIEHAQSGDLTFLANPAYEKFLSGTGATCVLVGRTQTLARKDQQVIRVDDPYAAFMVVQREFAPPPPTRPTGIHPSAVVAASAKIHATAAVAAKCVVGEGCVVGDGSVLHPHVVLGDSTTIGRNCTIFPNVSIYHGTRIGDNVTIHSGTVIGADGFGYVENDRGGYQKIPQNGIVAIDDDVEIGANCTIDRAAIGETHIGRGCKIDNLVMIAHNVILGEDSLIVAQAGVSGSTKIGRHVVLAGQAGVVGHIELADNVIVSAQSGVSKSLLKAGLYMGSPAQDSHTALRAAALQRQLPGLIEQVRLLTEQVKQLEEALRRESQS